MRYAIISDIHANIEALRNVIDDAVHAKVRRVICLGDVVGYGPLPAETVEHVRHVAAVVLAGNHDDAVSGRGSAEAFNGLAADAVSRHRDALSSADLEWLRGLPYTCRIEGAVAAHGDFVDPPKFYYVDDVAGAEQNFAATDAQLMFVGHTHTPAIAVVGDSGAVHLAGPQDFTLEPNKRYIVNPGSVGYPREKDGSCQSSYVIYDSTAKTVEFRFLPFSVASVMTRGRAPKKPSRARVVVPVAVAALALVAAGLAFALRPETKTVTKTVTQTKVVEVEKAEDPALVLARRELAFAPDDRWVSANLRLDPGPAELAVEFRDANGSPVGEPFRKTVKHSSKESVRIPSGAFAAIFTVRKLSSDASPVVAAFSPVAKKKRNSGQ